MAKLIDKPTPHDLEAEKLVLGSLFIDPSPALAAEVRDVVAAADFYDPVNRRIFQAICKAHDEGRPVDIVLTGRELCGDRIFRGLDCGRILEEIANAVPDSATGANAKFYAGIVRDLSLKAQLANLLADGYTRSLNGESSPAIIGDISYELERLTHAGAGPNATLPRSSAVIVKLGDVVPERVEWLWPNRFPSGKLSLISGDPGNGKTFLSAYLASCITRGEYCPDQPFMRFPQGGVIFLNAEDDYADTIVPRLISHGADLDHAIAIRAITDRADNHERQFDLGRDVEALDAATKQQGNTRAVFIDPISAYLGDVDSHKNAEVRAVLAPLADYAARNRVAVIGINHLNKGQGAAMYRGMGSLALVAAPRAAWCVARDKDDPTRRLLLPIKCNLSIDPTGLAFSIVDGIVCVDPTPVETTADDALAVDTRKGPDPTDHDDAKAFLADALANGPRPAKDLIEEADGAHSIAKRTLDRAKKSLGVVSYRETPKGPWLWKMPDDPHCHQDA